MSWWEPYRQIPSVQCLQLKLHIYAHQTETIFLIKEFLVSFLIDVQWYVTQKRISAPQSEIFGILLQSPKLYLSRDIFGFLGFFVLYIYAVYSRIYTIQCKVYYSYTAHYIGTGLPTKHATAI